MGILLSRIPSADDVAEGTYFLQQINTPQIILGVRIALVVLTVLACLFYLHVRKSLKQDRTIKGDR